MAKKRPRGTASKLPATRLPTLFSSGKRGAPGVHLVHWPAAAGLPEAPLSHRNQDLCNTCPPNQNKNIQKNSDLTDWFILLNIYWTTCWTSHFASEWLWLNDRSKNSDNTRILLNFILNLELERVWKGSLLYWISSIVQPLNITRSLNMKPEHWKRTSSRYP